MPDRSAARTTDKLSEAHSRFATAALFIYFGTALVALTLLLAAVLTDKTHNDEQSEKELLLETEVLGHRLGDHLSLLVAELERLGARSEVDFTDQSLEPERKLLDLAHEDSPLFNLGVAMLDKEGTVLFTEPSEFMEDGRSFGAKPYFLEVRDKLTSKVVVPTKGEPVLYAISPIVKRKRFAGAFIGGIDLTHEPSMNAAVHGLHYVKTLLATARGSVVYPPEPPAFTRSADWYSVFQRQMDTSTVHVLIDFAPAVVAAAPVPIGDLFLVNVANESDLFKESDQRLWRRLLYGVFVALAPMLALVVFLRGSLAQFRRSETQAVREEHLRTIGEAANVIAHEVRNSLNGIRMGVDLMMDRNHRPSERVVAELRNEIERLGTFTYQLMLFAKNPEPGSARVDLADALPSWLALTRDVAAETGATIELESTDAPLVVRGDPTLLRMVVSNLVSNALDAVAAASPPKIAVRLRGAGTNAEIRVSDNGSGVPPDLRDRLFTPFVTGKPSGVGMGLSISRKIAEAHGGSLVLEPESAEGGTSFRLTLPLESG